MKTNFLYYSLCVSVIKIGQPQHNRQTDTHRIQSSFATINNASKLSMVDQEVWLVIKVLLHLFVI